MVKGYDATLGFALVIARRRVDFPLNKYSHFQIQIKSDSFLNLNSVKPALGSPMNPT